MKKLITTTLAMMFAGYGYSQPFTDTNGNVGIGTTTPFSRLHIGQSNQEIRFDYNGSNNYYGSLRWAGLQFGNNGSNRIVAGRTASGGLLDFYVNNTNDAADYLNSPNGLLAMRLTADGNVGVGTAYPDNTQNWNRVLNLHGASHAKLMVTESSGVKVGIYSHQGYNGKMGTESNHNLTFTAGYWNDVMTLTTERKVGIATTNPSSLLHVFQSENSNNLIITDLQNSNNFAGLSIRANNVEYMGVKGNPSTGELRIGGFNANEYFTSIYSNNSETMRITGGNVSIGTTNPQGYKLAVAGNVIAESVKVALQGTWPDYVFKPENQLRSLHEVEKYVQVNSHLPEMPSAEQVKKDGIDLGQMDAKLLKKIEELTLYMIEQHKRSVEQEKLIAKQSSLLKEQNERILNLEKAIKK